MQKKKSFCVLVMLAELSCCTVIARTRISASEWSINLVKSGWPQSSAKSVVSLNQDWFSVLQEDAPEELERQLAILARLGQHPETWSFLELHPEFAGLLAVVDDPGTVVRSLANTADYASLASLYVTNSDPDDAAKLAQALIQHGDLIRRLLDRGFVGFETMFFGIGETAADREYIKWMSARLEGGLSKGNEDLAASVQLVVEQGPALRHRLNQNPTFLAKFNRELWPALVRSARDAGIGVEDFGSQPEIWNVLLLDGGEAAISRWGLLVVDVLFARESHYPPDLHPRLIQILGQASEQEVGALWRYRGEPLLHQLLRRANLGEATRRSILDRLGLQGAGALPLLASLDDRALARELGPPPSGPATWIPFYYAIEIPTKLLEGRPIPAGDLLSLGLDVIFIAMPVGKAVGPASNAVGKVTSTTLKNGATKAAAKQLGQKVAEKIGEGGLRPYLVREVFTTSSLIIRREVAKHASLEITGPIKAAFRYTQLGRMSFRRLTGLEARLFMRGDARVVVHLDKVLATGLANRYLKQTAESAIGGAILETPLANQVVDSAISMSRGALDKGIEAWQRNLSTWWLVTGTGMANRFE